MAEELKKAGPFDEIGVSGLMRTGGYVADEFLVELQGKAGAQMFREMSLNDDMIGGALTVLEQIARQVPTKVEPFDESRKSKKQAEFVDSVLHDMNRDWLSVRSEIFTEMLIYGWVYAEKVFKLRQGWHPGNGRLNSKENDGLLGVRKLATRAQDTLQEWIFDEEGGIKGMIQLAPPDYIEAHIPIEKSLLFRTRIRRNNPEGQSILRNAYVGYFFKKRIREVEGIAVERELAGMPMLKAPPKLDIWNPNNANAVAQLAIAKKVVRAVRSDALWGMLLPHDWEFDLVSSSGSRSIDTVAVINRYNTGMMISMLTDLLLVGHEKAGSWALSMNKSQLLAESIKAYLDAVHGVLNAHLVPDILRFNKMPTDTLPKLGIEGEIITPSVEELTGSIGDLTGAGWPLFPDTAVDTYLRQKLQLPEREKGEEVPMSQPKPQPGDDEPDEGDEGDDFEDDEDALEKELAGIEKEG